MSATAASLLLLADGRFPAGGHAHSGGLEQAIEDGRVRDERDVAGFLRGVIATTGANSAAFAAAACAAAHDGDRERLLELDAEESARIPSAALRTASRAQGRQLLRAARATWPAADFVDLSPLPHGPHLALTHGVTAAATGNGPREAALLSTYAAITAPATAAVRLLGLDPFGVNRVLASLQDDAEMLASTSAELARRPAAALPSHSAPLLEIGAERHIGRELRMFAS